MRPLGAGADPVDVERLADALAERNRGSSEAAGSWWTNARSPAQLAQPAAGRGARSSPSTRDRPGRRAEPDPATARPERGLARAGLADQAEHLARGAARRVTPSTARKRRPPVPAPGRRPRRRRTAAQDRGAGRRRPPGDRSARWAAEDGGPRRAAGGCTACCGSREESPVLGLLDDVAGLEHDHAVGQVGDHAHVVGDQQDAGAGALPQPTQQGEDLGLHRDVERGRGLVGQQQAGSLASARARTTRCFWPPESWCG